MRIIMHVSLPVETFNKAVRDGSVAATMKQILADQKPEAAYFCEWNGQRSGMLVVNVNDPREIPAFAEPWFLKFNATITFHPAMTAEELGAAGLEALGKKWG